MSLKQYLIDTLSDAFVNEEDLPNFDEFVREDEVGPITGTGNKEGILYVGESEEYQTIQSAIDTIPVDDSPSFNPGAKVMVMGDYDSSKETFPITLDRQQATIEGFQESSARIVVPDSVTEPAFDIRGMSYGDYRNTWELRNIRIRGGGNADDRTPCVRAYDSVQAEIDNVVFEHPKGPAIQFEDGVDGGNSFSNKINRVRINWGDSDGIVLTQAGANHDTTINQSAINKVDGRGVVLNGSSTTIRDSVVQHTGDWGIVMGDGNNVRVKDNYFEKNAQLCASGALDKHPLDVHMDSVNNGVVSGNYFFAYGTSRRAINVKSSKNVDIRNNRYNGYSNTDGHFLAIHGASSDVDVNMATNQGSADRFFDFDAGVRTRNAGIVRMQDTSQFAGRNVGDQAWDDGTNTVSGNPCLCQWDGEKWTPTGFGSPE